MSRRLRWLCILPVLAVLIPVPSTAAASTNVSSPFMGRWRAAPEGAWSADLASFAGSTPSTTTTTDYPGATWVPADPSNYSVANRPNDYPVNMIIIHDIEGSDTGAIKFFQTPGFAASANYVVSYEGQVTQMVREQDIAWHAGNWVYNTRAIGIEHEGFAYTPGLYTTAEYNASAQVAASICSRWGVPMDRTHVIGHSEVPDPNNPGLYGGTDHHTDPGPYWNWTYYMGRARYYASLLPSPPHMMVDPTVFTMDGGATVSWQAQTCRTPIASIQVVVQPGNQVINLPGTATSTTLTGLTNGTTYTVTVTATNADGTDSNSTTLIPSPPCTTPTLSSAPSSPSGTGASVILSATATGCLNPTYRFWIQSPSGHWDIVHDYGSAATYTWADTGNAGGYRAEVDVRQQTSDVVYDATANIPYTVTGCSAARLATDSLSPQPPGTVVTLTGSATCLGTPEYRFWTRPPGGRWGIVQDFSSTSAYSWNTTGKASGTYNLEVDVRDKGAAATYETVANATYVLGPAICRSPTFTASPGSSAATGSAVTFTTTSSGCASPRYRFWVAPPGGAWSILQNYSSATTFNWSGTGAPGSYRIEVDVRNSASTSSYDSVANQTYVLAGCTSAALATDKPSPQLTGTAAIVLTGTAACPGTPEFRFWIRSPGGAWSIAQNYSPTATYSWNTSKLAAGTYFLEVDVRDHGSAASYEAVRNSTFTLGGCINASLTADKPSPRPTGTTIVLTGSATCAGTPEYRFWVRATGGAWTIVRDYSPSASFSWTTTGKPAGTYYLEVDVRNQGSAASYETVANVTYALG